MTPVPKRNWLLPKGRPLGQSCCVVRANGQAARRNRHGRNVARRLAALTTSAARRVAKVALGKMKRKQSPGGATHGFSWRSAKRCAGPVRARFWREWAERAPFTPVFGVNGQSGPPFTPVFGVNGQNRRPAWSENPLGAISGCRLILVPHLRRSVSFYMPPPPSHGRGYPLVAPPELGASLGLGLGVSLGVALRAGSAVGRKCLPSSSNRATNPCSRCPLT
jgi:hypothetical protein